MQEHHRAHLLSTFSTVLQHLDEIRRTVTTGKTPAGGDVASLPDPQRGRLLVGLDQVAAALQEMVSCLVPDFAQVRQDQGDVGAARMWVNILLRTIEELVEDLRPARMSRRYGALEQRDAHALALHTDQVLARLRQVMREIENPH